MSENINDAYRAAETVDILIEDKYSELKSTRAKQIYLRTIESSLYILGEELNDEIRGHPK